MAEKVGAHLDCLAALAGSCPPKPPASAVESATSLRALTEDEQQAAALLVSGGAGARALCTATTAATVALETHQPAAPGLWGLLRVSVLHTLLQLCSSEASSIELLACTDGGAASVCAAVLASDDAPIDQSGLKVALAVLRNLALPASNRPRLGALEDGALLRALLRHIGHGARAAPALWLSGEATQKEVGATLRLLVEGCGANARRIASVAAAAGEGQLDVIDVVLALERGAAGLHPHAAAELARFVCLTVAGVWRTRAEPPPLDEAALARLMRAGALRFGARLLGYRSALLHREACDALRAALEAWRARGAADAPCPLDGIVVTSRGGFEAPLEDVLPALVAAGSLAQAECDLLLRRGGAAPPGAVGAEAGTCNG